LTTFERLVRGSFAPSVLLLFSLLFSFAAYAQGDNISQQIANLQDSDPRIRANAATDLGRFKDPRGVEPLIVALGDKNAKVRGQAAWALGQLHDLKATKPLIGLLKEKDMTVQLGVSMALGELKDPASIQPLIEAMNDRSLGDGRFPGVALWEIGPAAVEPLMALLHESDPSVRRNATRVLAEIRDPRSVDLLIVAVHDKDAEVRAAAAWELAPSNDPRALEPMIEAFRDPDAKVRSSTLGAILRSGDPRAIDILKAALKDPVSQVRIDAAAQLGYSKTDWAFTLLVEALKTVDNDLRHSAARALGGTADPRAVEALIGLLKDKDGMVQFSACSSLGKLKDRRAVEPLTMVLLASIFNGNAADALGEIGDPRAIGPLVQAVRDPKNQSKDTYTRALGKIGGPAVEALIGLSKDADHNGELAVRRDAIFALGLTGDSRAVPTLIAALEDRDGMVASNAGSALAALKDPRGIAPLIKSLKLEPGPEQGGVFRPYWLAQFGSPAVEPLLAVLRDPNARTRLRAASALAQIGDPRVSRALLDALHEKDYAAVAGGYEFYIDAGVPESEDALIQALNLRNDDDDHMARVLVSCGNAKLEAAGRAWEKRRFGSWDEGAFNPFWGARALASSKAAQLN
jgi:HEAT repeat protein